MNQEEWFQDKKNIQKSRKPYAHFDLRTDILRSKSYITNSYTVAHHGFYPFIKFSIIYRRYNKKPKVREICYSAHIDRCIYQYYSYLINEKYNLRLEKDNISQVPVAYRTNLHISNIDVVQSIIKFIRKFNSCYIMIGDFTDFFGKINHKYLKKQLCNLLNVNELRDDYYAVFKSVTKYSAWDLKKILQLNHFDNKRKYIRKLNSQERILSKQLFKHNKNQIEKNTSFFGIPQGSAISACFANVYMLEIDKDINDFVQANHGIYKRYSDDFIIVLPESIQTKEKIEEIIKLFENYKDKSLLELQPEKTQVFYLKNPILKNIGHDFYPKLNEDQKYMNFLGFSFDGTAVKIRPKTISKYFYRMRHKAIGIASRYSKNGGFKGSDKLYIQYSERGKDGKGNFFSYLERANGKFSNDDLDKATKNHMTRIRRILKE